jgi:metal-dependent amidase/aminoacylase/carboxypeptidase family protein
MSNILELDMDALPLMETADISYCSKNKGVMHACGHDGHMSALMCAAKVLQKVRVRMRSVILCELPIYLQSNSLPSTKVG